MDKETAKIKNVVMAHKTKAGGVESAYLYPMDKWHLYSNFKDGKRPEDPYNLCGCFLLSAYLYCCLRALIL